MTKLTKDHKKEYEDKNYFKEGVHKVKIGLIEFGETDKGQEFAEFTLIGENEEEGTARLWFTTDAAINYAFNIFRSIFVHNAPEDKKDAVRKKIDSLGDTDQLEKACSMLIGKECWYLVQENKDRPYTTQSGEQRFSFDRNVYGYEPKPKSDTSTAPEKEDKTTLNDMDNDTPIAGF